MRRAKKLLNLLAGAIFPIECLACGKEGAWICNDCLLKIPLKTDFPCIVCGRATIFGRTHKECREKTAIDGMLCATDYDNQLVKAAIQAFKYKYARDLGRYLGWLLAKYMKNLQGQIKFKEILTEGISARHLAVIKMVPFFLVERLEGEIRDKNENEVGAGRTQFQQLHMKPLLVPVPLHSRRLRERGFNQAEILARELGRYFDWETATDILRRTRYTTAQMSQKTQERRIKNIKGAFELDAKLRKICEIRENAKVDAAKIRNDESETKMKSEAQIKNRTIILVDDVLTTGATTSEAGRVLKEAGAREVWVMGAAKD